MGNTQKVEFANFQWINFITPNEKQISELGVQYKFHPLDIADCLNTSHRSKTDTYPQYNFFVLLFPTYQEKTREIVAAKINIFIGKDFLITIQHQPLKTINDFLDLVRVSNEWRDKYTDKTPEKLLYDILHKLLNANMQMIDHLILDSDNIQRAIFSGQERKMVSEILIIRRNITDVRNIMQGYKNILKKSVYSFKENMIFSMKKSDAYFESLVDYSKEIWDSLENLKERIEALQQTNESQISFKLSDTMRILTIISVITFPLTLVAAIFGMNAERSMPISAGAYGFWYIIALMLIITIAMIIIFKKKGLM